MRFTPQLIEAAAKRPSRRALRLIEAKALVVQQR
jgi:hypothetical protein